jgi:hypothetical protein
LIFLRSFEKFDLRLTILHDHLLYTYQKLKIVSAKRFSQPRYDVVTGEAGEEPDGRLLSFPGRAFNTRHRRHGQESE